MKNIFAKFRGLIFWLTCFVLYNPLIVKAANEGAEKQNELNPVEMVICLIVLVVVTYKVYHAMYGGTTIIGTREGIRREKNAMLVIPLFCGIIVAGIVLFLLRILFKIIIVLLIIAAVIGVIVLIYKLVSKKGNASSETVVGQSDGKAITDASMSVSGAENTIQGTEGTEAVSDGDKTETFENEIKDTDDSLRSIMSKLDIHDMYDETGMPITEGALLVKARKNFGIPASENVYFIHDNTLFCSCKTGFAICESGIYICMKQKKYIPWAEFKTTQITNTSFLNIDGENYNVSGNIEDTPKQNIVYEALLKIQKSIE